MLSFPSDSNSKLIDTAKLNRLNDKFKNNGAASQQMRLKAVSAKHSGAFLNSELNFSQGPRMSNEQFKTAALMRIGHSFVPAGTVCPRAHATTTRVDALNSHFVTCKAGDGDTVIHRHNDIRDWLIGVAQEGHVGVEKEPRYLIPQSNQKPADLLIYLNGRSVAIDVTVANSVQPIPADIATVRACDAAKKKEQEKRNKYSANLNAVRIDFRPFAVETYGGLGTSAYGLIEQFAEIIASNNNEQPGPIKKRLFTELSIVLQRNNAKMINNRHNAVLALVVPPAPAIGVLSQPPAPMGVSLPRAL